MNYNYNPAPIQKYIDDNGLRDTEFARKAQVSTIVLRRILNTDQNVKYFSLRKVAEAAELNIWALFTHQTPVG